MDRPPMMVSPVLDDVTTEILVHRISKRLSEIEEKRVEEKKKMNPYFWLVSSSEKIKVPRNFEVELGSFSHRLNRDDVSRITNEFEARSENLTSVDDICNLMLMLVRKAAIDNASFENNTSQESIEIKKIPPVFTSVTENFFTILGWKKPNSLSHEKMSSGIVTSETAGDCSSYHNFGGNNMDLLSVRSSNSGYWNKMSSLEILCMEEGGSD